VASRWKRLIEVGLAGTGVASVLSRLRTPTSIVLAYHNIVPTGQPVSGDSSLHVDQETFAAQLEFLDSHATIVPLDQIRPGPHIPGRDIRVAVTFDDAYRGAMTAGLEELAKRGLPATVFVSPGLLGSEGFWWDRLTVDSSSALPDGVRDHALNHSRGIATEVLSWARREGYGVGSPPAHATPVTESELLDSDLYDGLTVGAHTWSHPNLAALSEIEAVTEMTRSKEWLASRTARYVDWLAYPYGLHSPSVVKSASLIFEGALRVEGGAAERRGRWVASPHTMPRVNVPRGLSIEGLALRIAGLLS
jgi:peptidoglycan/xylan/chitin deacetylase (PgdA/CDA1 family)